MHDMPIASSGPDDYKKRQEAIKRKLSEAAGKSDSKILDQTNREEQRDKPTIQDNCQMVHRLVSEGLEMYREGDMTLKEFVEDLNLSLKALLSVVKDEPGKKEKHMMKPADHDDEDEG